MTSYNSRLEGTVSKGPGHRQRPHDLQLGLGYRQRAAAQQAGAVSLRGSLHTAHSGSSG